VLSSSDVRQRARRRKIRAVLPAVGNRVLRGGNDLLPVRDQLLRVGNDVLHGRLPVRRPVDCVLA